MKPRGARANSWQDVSDLSASLHVPLDDWQDLILEAAMGERMDHTWAAKRVGISVPRQNGKSQLLVSRALAGALLFGEKKIVISAHQQDTARESFSKLIEIVEDDENEWLRSQLDTRFGRGGIMNALNREAVKFLNGSQIQFKARSGAASKGFSSDCLLLDEAQILGSRAWTSINSTMSAMRNPQVWLLGTPPQEEDDCYTFDMVRKAAIDGVSTTTTWCEWSADPNSPDFDPASEYTRWSANPAWNIRINHEVVQGEYETYTSDKFNQDRLGIWRDDTTARRLISKQQWEATASEPPDSGTKSFAIAFSADGTRQSVAGAVKHAAGVHVNLVGAYSGSTEAGVAAVADWLVERKATTAEVAVAGAAGRPLVDALIQRKFPARLIRYMSSTDVVTANALMLDAIREGMVTHPIAPPEDALEQSVAVSDRTDPTKRQDGSWRWEATTPDGDETPMEAISFAHWVARTTKRRPKGSRSGSGVTIL